MNEQKKSFQNYMNPYASKRDVFSLSLIEIIKKLLSHSTKMSINDVIYLKSMLKQLKQQNNNMSNKVLRGIEKRLQLMQTQYQRG